MSTFDKREEAFEKKFALEQEQKFKAEAHRDKLLGLWAAAKLGKQGEEAAGYAMDLVAVDIEGGLEGVVEKVKADLAPIRVTEHQIRRKIEELTEQAGTEAERPG
jgi:hypothetical protein